MALRLAPERVTRELGERCRDLLVDDFAVETRLEQKAAAAVLDAEGQGVEKLLDHTGAWQRSVLLRAARLGDARASARLYGRGWTDPELLDAVFTAVLDPDGAEWGGGFGLRTGLIKQVSTRPTLLDGCPFPEVTLAAASAGCPEVPFAFAIDFCIRVAEDCGASGLRDLAGEDLGHQGLPELLIEAAESEDPTAVLKARRPRDEWNDPQAFTALAYARCAYFGFPPTETPPLDWDLVRREHERLPFKGYSLAAWTAWPDCPDDLHDAAFRADAYRASRAAARLSPRLLAFPEVADHPEAFGIILHRAIHEGHFPVEAAFGEPYRAGTLLAELPIREPSVRAALAPIAERIGATPSAWIALYALLEGFAGAVNALPDAVAAAGRPATWPYAQPAAFPATRPEGARAAFTALLGSAAADTLRAVIPCLDGLGLQQLALCTGDLAYVPAILAESALAAASDAAAADLIARLGDPAIDPVGTLTDHVGRHTLLPWDALARAAENGLLGDSVLHGPLFDDHGRTARFVVAACSRIHNLAGDDRAVRALRATVAPEDILNHARGPARWLRFIATDPEGRQRLTLGEPCAAARALTAQHLGDDTDAWHAAIRMFDTFPGTFAELLATAARMTATKPGD